MRKKLLSNVMLLLTMLFVGVGSAWADEVVYKTAKFGSDYNSKKVSSYTDTWTATNENFTVSLTNFNNNNNGWAYVKCGRKNTASVASITSEAIDKAITKVVVTIDNITANKVNSIKLFTSSDNSTWNEVGSYSKEIGAQEVTLSSPQAGLYYKVEFDCDGGTSNGLVTVSQVEYYYNTSGSTQTAIATINGITPTTINLNATGTFQLDATIVDNAGYNVSWETSDASVLELNGSSYEAKAIGDVTVNVKITPTDTENYYEVSKGITVKVVDPNANDGSEDKPFTVAEAIAYINTLGSSTSPNAMYVSGIVSQVDSYNSTYSSITYWISDDGTTATQLEVYSGKGLNSADFDSQDDVTVGDVVTVYGKLKMYNNTPEFTQNNYLVSTTHQTVAKAETTVTIGGALTNVDVFTSTEAGQLTASVTSENVAVAGATVTWSSSNTQVATIDEDGNVTLVAKGTVKFTATYAGDATYKGSSATTDEYTVISTKPAPAAVVYSKVTSALQLVEGAEYLMVYEDAAVALGVVDASKNIGTTVPVTIGNGQISITDEAVNVLTLTKSTFDDWHMAASLNDGAYLAWESGNTLITKADETSKNARWTIEYADGVATIKNMNSSETETRVLQYNTGSPRFATYKGTQKAVALYIKGEVAPVVAVGAAGWTSFVPAKNVAFPGVNAYIVTANNTESVTLTEVAAVKAGTPVLVEATEGEYALEVVEESACADVTTNLLSASDGNVTGNGSIYALGQKNNEVGLYLVADGVTIPAGKAYLNGGGNDVKTFVFGGETAIQSVEAAANNAAIYNLAGQRVQKTVKGLYIQNGRKFIVK